MTTSEGFAIPGFFSVLQVMSLLTERSSGKAVFYPISEDRSVWQGYSVDLLSQRPRFGFVAQVVDRSTIEYHECCLNEDVTLFVVRVLDYASNYERRFCPVERRNGDLVTFSGSGFLFLPSILRPRATEDASCTPIPSEADIIVFGEVEWEAEEGEDSQDGDLKNRNGEE